MARNGLLTKPLFSLAIFLLLAGVITAGLLHRFHTAHSADHWVEHTHRVLHHATQLSSDLHEAESATRGHVATGNEDFLASYRRTAGSEDAPGSIDAEITELRRLVQDNREQSARLEKITELIAKKRTRMEQTIALAHEDPVTQPTKAQEMVAEGTGLQLMEDIRRQLNEFRDRESGLLLDRQKEAERQEIINATVLILLALMLVGVMVAAFLTIRKEFGQRQAVEKTLRETTTFQQALLRGASYAIIACEPNGIVRLFNPAAEQLTGYSAAEIVGKYTPELWHLKEEVVARAKQLSGQLGVEIKPGLDVFTRKPQIQGTEEREWTYLRKDGTHVPVSLSATALFDDHGKLSGYLGIAKDIGERKHVDQMKNEFISTVSHELRTPLTSIRGALGLITGSMNTALPEQARQLVAIAHKNSERLVRLINNILDIEKIESGHMVYETRVLDVDTIITHAAEELAALAVRSGISISTKVTGGAHVMGDEDRLLQAFSNLLSNAIKYSPPNGSVYIEAERTGDHIVITVRDEGEGIPNEFKPRIFGKFAQADSSDSRQKAGSGLGLSITKAIVESMNGTIDFESAPGRTVFRVLLPEWRGNTDIASSSWRARKILVVEDDEDIAALLKLSLEQEGFACDIVGTAKSAREHLAMHPYCAITLDLALPDGDVISLIRELRQQEATMELPVVVISANAEAGKKKLNGDAIGVLGWLPKPIDLDRLKRMLSGVQHSNGIPQILYIEDESDIITLMSTALEGTAIVEAAGSLKEARHILKRRQFDLAMLDINLPDGNGLDLLPELAARPRPIPVIILSVSETPQEVQQRVSASLVKSVAPEDKVIETIKSLLKRRQS
jgi:signal transduction histidine kinase/DNA-binding response OmpR family regulator/CHASE3 domain sensor protein